MEFRLIYGILLIIAVGCEARPRVTYLHIISEIQARFAVTDVLSQVENEGSSAEEVTFRAVLPDAAFISNFSL